MTIWFFLMLVPCRAQPPAGVDTSQGGGPPASVTQGGGQTPGAPDWLQNALAPVSASEFGNGTSLLGNNDELIMGVLAPITRVSTTFLASIVSADLEFRKNHDAHMIERFGPPIINITDLNPKLKIKVQIGNACDSLGRIYHLLGYSLGYYNSTVVQATVAGTVSNLNEISIAKFITSYNMPGVGFGASNPDLTNSQEYAYYSRTFPSDRVQAKGIWRFLQHFSIPAITSLYSSDLYGSGLFTSLTDLAAKAGQAYRVSGVAVSDMAVDNYDFEEYRQKVKQAVDLGVRIVLLGMPEAHVLMFAIHLEQAGLFSPSWQLIASAEVQQKQYSLTSLPTGFIRFRHVNKGRLFSAYEKQMWNRLTRDDVMGADAMERYSLGKFPAHCPLGSSALPLPDSAMFSSLSMYHLLDPFLFDSVYAYIVAFNALLNAGFSIPQIKGKLLLTALRNVTFEGLTGTVGFNAKGDRRHSKYSIENMMTESDGSSGRRLASDSRRFKSIGVYDEDSDSLEFSDSVLWMTGEKQSSLPASLIACALGHFEDPVTKLCKPCGKGSMSLGGVGAECSLCPGGKYANETRGASACVACEFGKFGAEAGTTACIACEVGKYSQDVGARHCELCAGGEYQDASGTSQCKKCDEANHRMTTIFRGAASRHECGCKEGYIEVPDDSAFNRSCQLCTTGLDCPKFSELSRFIIGIVHEGEEGLVAKLQAGFMSAPSDPLVIYECRPRDICPGGVPGNCKGGREGIPCANCPPGYTWRGEECKKCRKIATLCWRTSTPVFLAACIVAYYSMNSPVTAKAAKRLPITSSLGLMVTALQFLAIISSINVPAMPDPPDGYGILMTIFGADFANIEYDCAVGRDVVWQYFSTVAIFPMGIAWFCLAALISQVAPPRFRFKKYPLASTIGSFLHLTLTTLCMVGLKPFMCYSHPSPNHRSSLTQYPSVVCGTPEHTIMQIGGVALLCLALAFLSSTTLIAFAAPAWSRTVPQRFRALKFILFRFRMDCWAYGSINILRGPLITLPLVFATDSPHIQIFLATITLVAFLVMQLAFWPWKVPLLNLVDMWVSIVLIAMATITNSFLPAVTDQSAGFYGIYCGVQLSLVFVAVSTIILALAALSHRNITGGIDHNPVLNLGQVPDSEALGHQLKEMSIALSTKSVEEIGLRMDILHVNDLRTILRYITLAVFDMGVGVDGTDHFLLSNRLQLPSDYIPRRSRRPRDRLSRGERESRVSIRKSGESSTLQCRVDGRSPDDSEPKLSAFSAGEYLEDLRKVSARLESLPEMDDATTKDRRQEFPMSL